MGDSDLAGPPTTSSGSLFFCWAVRPVIFTYGPSHSVSANALLKRLLSFRERCLCLRTGLFLPLNRPKRRGSGSSS